MQETSLALFFANIYVNLLKDISAVYTNLLISREQEKNSICKYINMHVKTRLLNIYDQLIV